MTYDPAGTLAQWWHEAERVAILTGAGISAESGVPTFRDARDGLWARFDPERLASMQGFRDDPDLVWGWYLWRMAVVWNAQPHAGHRALTALAATRKKLPVITQNVDDLHERAGNPDVIHLHGDLFETRCVDCGEPFPAIEIPDRAAQEPQQRVPPPVCGHCGGIARPGVVWFGEPLPEPEFLLACSLAGTCDLLIAIGTSGEVAPASSFPSLVKERGGRFAEINPEWTWLTPHADLSWRATAAEALPELLKRVEETAKSG